jgi:hypothetical protein
MRQLKTFRRTLASNPFFLKKINKSRKKKKKTKTCYTGKEKSSPSM